MDALGIEEPQNHYSNFHNRKPRLHFFCSHDRVAVIPRRRDLMGKYHENLMSFQNPEMFV